ncbi:hypothetical protein DW322_08850 [Rhodococcus rhodnii]|uniref:Tail assembly chaperone n=2 Tax=Rhodococcus rhodnii TaxID=38312 RepID=R7WRE9_9NOCA|nr:hypothetical protein [Rhodococcus rhodnii]EOM77902.1 hypothetical protein Rrhod_0711 [Rhodococcus rhodnii LMG 5362]TXG90313.1 hypothetical protein DW322_08850 [Rhodococcus rhodnii]
MAFRITPAFEADTIDIEIPLPGGKSITLELPQLGFVDPKIARAVDDWQTARFQEVQKTRDDLNKKRQPIIESDPAVTYPSPLDLMDRMLEHLDADAAVVVAGLSFREREQIWKHWNDESKVDAAKSSASSDSSTDEE